MILTGTRGICDIKVRHDKQVFHNLCTLFYILLLIKLLIYEKLFDNPNPTITHTQIMCPHINNRYIKFVQIYGNT